jgi:hypothetical protein
MRQMSAALAQCSLALITKAQTRQKAVDRCDFGKSISDSNILRNIINEFQIATFKQPAQMEIRFEIAATPAIN